MASCAAGDWRGRPAAILRNGFVEAVILTGGGHLVSLTSTVPGDERVNPLWEPPWSLYDPALRRLAVHNGELDPEGLESELLGVVGGFNLCCDVFGSHSAGELAAGLCFHGEAGLVSWEVESYDRARGALTLTAELRRSMLRVSRTYTLEGPTLCFEERITNLCGFERVLGRAQHVTIGDRFLLRDPAAADVPADEPADDPKAKARAFRDPLDEAAEAKAAARAFRDPLAEEEAKRAARTFRDPLAAGGGASDARVPCCAFTASCDEGMTWPEEHDPTKAHGSKWAVGERFSYPRVPRKDGATDDWRRFPREGSSHSSDLCTLRVDPADKHGWFVAERSRADGGPRLAFACAWERETFPWLMTWEEHRARAHRPWNSRTTCRGLEVSSYAFATSRRDNVERGRLLDTPCFEWLDANETKATTFRLSLQRTDGKTADEMRGTALCGLA